MRVLLMFPFSELQLLSSPLQLEGKPMNKRKLGEAVDDKTIANETLGYFIGRTALFLMVTCAESRQRACGNLPPVSLLSPSSSPCASLPSYPALLCSVSFPLTPALTTPSHRVSVFLVDALTDLRVLSVSASTCPLRWLTMPVTAGMQRLRC
eukprot:759980-Hanusia_phi.AAC.7